MSSPRKPPKASKDPLADLLGNASDRSQKRLERAKELVREVVEEELEPGSSFEDYERAVMEIVNEIARRELERKLQGIADSHAPRLRIDHNNDWHGIREGTAFNYAKHHPGTVTYHSLVGGLRVTRFTYRECYRNGVTYVPLELDAGLIEKLTPGLARCVALGFADMPMRRFERLLCSAGCRPPSRSTLERSAKDIGGYAVVANGEIEPVIRAKELVPAGAKRVVLGLDRTAVPMRSSDRARGIAYTEYDLRRNRPRPSPWLAKGGVQWRMDYVGTVTWVDGVGKRLASRHYRLPADVEPEHITSRMMADVCRSLEQSPELAIAVVQDGAPELWKAVTDALRTKTAVEKWDEILDWYHLDERLNRCLELCIHDTKKRAAARKKWHQKLLETPNGAAGVLASLRGHKGRLEEPEREELDVHIRYLTRRKKQTRYAECRSRGLPIGSGPTEGACKSLIALRAKRSGQRWSQRGLSSALHLRSVEQSGRFDAFWSVFAQRYRATSLAPF